jgi:esterase
MTVFFSEEKVRQRGKVAYRDGYVKLRGRNVHYVDYGGAGEIVVALHGYVQNAHAFDGIAPVLVPHVRLLALDARGRGESDKGPPESYRMNYYLRDLRDFFETIGLSRFALIGTSMGGHLALLYSMAHPLEVTRLILNDLVLDHRTEIVRPGQKYARAPASFSTVQDAISWFLKERSSLNCLDEEARLAWVGHFLTPSDGGFRFHCDPVLLRLAAQRPVQSNIGATQNAYRQLLREQSKRLKMPVLILRGANSEVVLRENARRMVDSLPAAICVEVPGAGHSPTLYEPAAQNALRDFFGISAG